MSDALLGFLRTNDLQVTGRRLGGSGRARTVDLDHAMPILHRLEVGPVTVDGLSDEYGWTILEVAADVAELKRQGLVDIAIADGVRVVKLTEQGDDALAVLGG